MARMERIGAPRADVEERSREVRLGLVLYGGVALAIYINGVAAEFFRVVRGRGVYRLLKALTDSDVVVDIVSGTSAGGINGIFLAYALCNDREFADSAMIWREHGGIRKLLRDPLADSAKCRSVLDSEGYYQPHIEAAFARLGPAAPERHGYASPIKELDLFVTATNVDGRVSTQFDDAGHTIEVKNHRQVFLLKHRAGRREPFRTSRAGGGDQETRVTFRALAKLARATSAFPAAFAPVGVGACPEPIDAVDAKLREWGQLEREAFFLDGGVLDNKPFTHTIRQIFSRVADREVDRKLLYVEPDPEHFEQRTATDPNFLQAILLSLIGIPGYESIANDLRLLAERNSKLEQYSRLVKRLQPLTGEARRALPDEALTLYWRSRMIALSQRVVRGLLAGGDSQAELKTAQKVEAARLVETFDSLVIERDQMAAMFRDFDVSYRQRRINRVVYLLHERLFGDSAGEQRADYQTLLQLLNRQSKAYEIVLAAMESLVDDATLRLDGRTKVTPEAVWGAVSSRFHALLADDAAMAAILPDRFEAPDRRAASEGELRPVDWLPQRQLSVLNGLLTERARRLAELPIDDGQTDGSDAASVLVRLDHLEAGIIEELLPDSDDQVRRAYDDFEILDAQVYPLELIGGLNEKDIIETVRISPRDAQRGFSDLGLSGKVAGDVLYHFGGFFKRSWRSNDILWGRLDGACQLVEILMARDRIKSLMDKDGARSAIRVRLFERGARDGAPSLGAIFDPKVLFARAGPDSQGQIASWLERLLSDDAGARAEALEPGEFERMTELLIEAEQLQIIGEELPNVISDALVEEREWNRFRNPEGRFDPASEHFDPFLTSLAAAQRAREELLSESATAPGTSDEAPTRPRETWLGRYFRNTYKVGSEELLRDIPTHALLEILAVALLIVRNCILDVFGNNADRVKRNPLYRFVLNPLLWVLYLLVVVSRRAPRRALWLLLGGMVAAAFVLLLGLLWHSTAVSILAGVWLLLSALIGIGWLDLKTRSLKRERPAGAA
jgi:patatin-related protein